MANHNSQKSHVSQKNPPCIFSIQKTGFSRAALLLVGPRLQNFVARRDVWWGRSYIGSHAESVISREVDKDTCTLLQLIVTYSGSQSHTTRRGRASCSLWYAPVANVCDLLLFLDENRVIPEFRHFWKRSLPRMKSCPQYCISYDLTQKNIHWPHNTGMMVT